MISGVLMVVHVLVCLVLIVVVLMQSQQSMNLSGMFGGASQSAIGNRPESVLSKATTILAIVFMLTSVVFAMWPSEHESALEGDQTAPDTQQQAPAQPSSPDDATNQNGQNPSPDEDNQPAPSPSPGS